MTNIRDRVNQALVNWIRETLSPFDVRDLTIET